MFKNIGHFFASLAHGIVKAAVAVKGGAQAAAGAAPAIAKGLATAEVIVEAVTTAAGAGGSAVDVERNIFHIGGDVLAAVDAAGDAAGANGLNVQLDATAVAKAREVLSHIGFGPVQP